MIIPKPLCPGDAISIVAPASPFEPVLAWVGMGYLSQRYRIRFERGLFSRSGYLAGNDERRRDELQKALCDPQTKAIWAARGGYGVLRILKDIDWSALTENPKWIVGFSDITALHLEAHRIGVASIHGAHITALGRADERTRKSIVQLLENPGQDRKFTGLKTITKGIAEGPLFGGNLTLLHACAAAGRLHIPPGSILLLEDVTERPYRIDRMLASLSLGDHLSRLGAIVLGDFDQCDPLSDGIRVEQVLQEHLCGLGIPVIAGAPIGHARRNEPVVLGSRALIMAAESGAELTLFGVSHSPSPKNRTPFL